MANPSYISFLWPNKVDEPHQVRITTRENLLAYDSNVTTNTASMETIKAHWNQVISTQDACYGTGDLPNIYLMSNLTDSEYIKFNYNLISHRTIEHYNLDAIVGSFFLCQDQ